MITPGTGFNRSRKGANCYLTVTKGEHVRHRRAPQHDGTLSPACMACYVCHRRTPLSPCLQADTAIELTTCTWAGEEAAFECFLLHQQEPQQRGARGSRGVTLGNGERSEPSKYKRD